MSKHDRIVAICRGDFKVGAPIIWTPAMVKAEFERVHTEILSFERDVYAWWQASEGMGEDEEAKRDRFKEAWRAFSDQWKEYRANALKGLGSGWGGHVDRVQQYGKDLTRWREAFQKEGGSPTGPAPRPPEESTFPWKTILIVAGAAAGAIWGVPAIIRAINERNKLRNRGF